MRALGVIIALRGLPSPIELLYRALRAWTNDASPAFVQAKNQSPLKLSASPERSNFKSQGLQRGM